MNDNTDRYLITKNNRITVNLDTGDHDQANFITKTTDNIIHCHNKWRLLC